MHIPMATAPAISAPRAIPPPLRFVREPTPPRYALQTAVFAIDTELLQSPVAARKTASQTIGSRCTKAPERPLT
jgi:hypothetical protein